MNTEFDKQLAILCAGFNVPCTPERLEAYGKAFGKLPPIGWSRLVEYCLGEHGPDRMPNVRELWQLRGEMRAKGKAEDAQPREPEWPGDAWDAAANRHMLALAMRKALHRTWSNKPESASVFVAAKNAWAADMRDLAANNGGVVDQATQHAVWDDYLTRAEERLHNQTPNTGGQ